MPNGDDIDMLLEKLGGDFSMIMKISLGRFSVEEAKQIVELMGKVVINIGDGLTLLHVAAQNDRCDLIEYFCVKTVVGETPLDQAAWKGFEDTSILLIKFGADVDSQTNGLYTPLHRCAFYNHIRLAGLLCMAGADQTIRDENNQTAYEVAVEQGNTKVASLLKPIEGVPGGIYIRNNPKHPEFRPEGREALFNLHAIDATLQQQNDDATHE